MFCFNWKDVVLVVLFKCESMVNIVKYYVGQPGARYSGDLLLPLCCDFSLNDSDQYSDYIFMIP